jgi:hypothetical protein
MSRFAGALAPPPRPVSPLLALGVLFGGFLQLFGAAFFSFGMVFAWLFAGEVDQLAQLAFRGPSVHTTATVLGTAASGKEGRRRIFEVTYRYQYEGTSRTGRGYTFDDGDFPEGRALDVEVLIDAPERSRAEGLRIKQFGLPALVSLVFPAAGLIALGAGLRRGARALRLLRHGVLSTGRLIQRHRTGGHVNNRPIYRLVYEFRDQRGETRFAEARAHDLERLTDEAAEPLLYAPNRADEAVLLDELPTVVAVRAHGGLAVENPVMTALRVATALSLLGVHGYVAFRLL